jgi:hypothetical protein
LKAGGPGSGECCGHGCACLGRRPWAPRPLRFRRPRAPRRAPTRSHPAPLPPLPPHRQVRLFYGLLPQRQRWADLRREPALFVIDEVFGVPGVGTVVAGTVKRGVLTPASGLLLGPDIADGSFKVGRPLWGGGGRVGAGRACVLGG